jgi:Domain of unknown function (DUF4440)
VRQILLFSLLLLASAVQGESQNQVHTKRYQIAGAIQGATGEYETPAQLQLLDDFDQSKFLDKYDHALLTNDRAALNDMIADRVVWVSERFGKGEDLTKKGVLASFGQKKVISVAAHNRDHVLLRVFGNNTIVMTGNSTSVLTYQDKVSKSNRLFATVYMKLDGRWQCTVHTIMDYDGLLPGSALANIGDK